MKYWKMLKYVQEVERIQKDYKYNFIGLFGVLLNRQLERRRAFFCSEFVATILIDGGVHLPKNKPACLIKPMDLIGGKENQLIYEGKLSSYFGNENTGMDCENSGNRFRAATVSYFKRFMSITS